MADYDYRSSREVLLQFNKIIPNRTSNTVDLKCYYCNNPVNTPYGTDLKLRFCSTVENELANGVQNLLKTLLSGN